MPSVVGVVSVNHGKAQFVFGQTAVDLSNICYVDEGFSIFYDMKRWISDYEKYIYKWMYDLIIAHKSDVLALGEP